MQNFSSMADRNTIEAQMPWEKREKPVTMYGLLQKTVNAFGKRNAVSFQITSGPKDKAETITWQQLHDKTVQSANLFRSLGIGENDVVAYLLPNCNETLYTLMGGMIAGIVNPINPLLDAEQISAILRETGATVLVTLKSDSQQQK